MENPDVSRFAVFVHATDVRGVLARCGLLFQRLGLNIDFVRFGPVGAGVSTGLFEFSGERSLADRLARKLRSAADVIAVDLAEVSDEPRAVKSSLPRWGRHASTPRDLDDLFDAAPRELPVYARELAEGLRRFRVTPDLIGVAPAIVREAACHIERIESENLLLLRADRAGRRHITPWEKDSDSDGTVLSIGRPEIVRTSSSIGSKCQGLSACDSAQTAAVLDRSDIVAAIVDARLKEADAILKLLDLRRIPVIVVGDQPRLAGLRLPDLALGLIAPARSDDVELALEVLLEDCPSDVIDPDLIIPSARDRSARARP